MMIGNGIEVPVRSTEHSTFWAVLRAGLVAIIAAGIGVALAISAQAEPRISRMDQTIGTHFPYHAGTYLHWHGGRDTGLREPFYPARRKTYRINPSPVVRDHAPRLHSRSRHVTGADLYGLQGGSPHRFDVDGWYGFAEVPPVDDDPLELDGGE